MVDENLPQPLLGRRGGSAHESESLRVATSSPAKGRLGGVLEIGEEVVSERKNNFKRLRYHRKNLRNNSTKSEIKLWSYLSNGKFCNKKFRRQHSFYNYILDFYCAEIKLCIELDGDIHNRNSGPEYDRVRDKFLNDNGIMVLRFKNSEIENEVENVLKIIRETIISWDYKGN